jgi:hypothetical protein
MAYQIVAVAYEFIYSRTAFLKVEVWYKIKQTDGDKKQ